MDIQGKLELIKRNTAEIITEDELIMKLKKKKKLNAYCGYETSGEIHLGHLVTMTKLLDLQKAGINVKVLFADWHTWLNRKGDWKFIHEQVDLWKKGFKAVGLNKAEFVLGSSFQRDMKYIDDVIGMSLQTTINRALRSMEIVARDIEHARVSQVIYPFMQLADIKHMKIDLVVAGLEQRRIHMMGAEGLFKEIRFDKPAFIHTPLITALTGPGGKMSSSKPETNISIRDTDKAVVDKIKKAYCPEGNVEDNSILQICRLILFPRLDNFTVRRDAKFGGDVSYESYDALEKDFVKKKLHPADLKKAAGDYLCEVLGPIRKAFGK